MSGAVTQKGRNAFDLYRVRANRTRLTPAQICEQTGLPADINAALGLAGEAGETADLFKKRYFQGKQLEREDLKEELGDVLFYLDWLAVLHGLTLGEIADANIAKLRQRYPNGFVMGGGKR